ncbi:hypothetical protein EV360DRAFT_86847 [Lentinula raphanica]|nr:hypothetical protein EV360DRAFT_86847 [Lentinula raphanica]
MNGIPSFMKDSVQQPQQLNGHHGMSSHNIPSTSATPFPDFSMNNLNIANNNSQMRLSHSQESLQNFNLMNSSWGAPHQSQQHAASILTQPQLSQLTNQWNNPTQSQFMTGMANMPMNMNMPAFNLSLIQQQMLHDALALSSPVVGADDERLLIDTLVDARARRDNFKNALNSLHGRNNHSATMWKDFYLECKDKIDTQVSVTLRNKGIPDPYPLIKVAKKPTPASFLPEPSPPSSPVEVKKRKGRPRKTSTPRAASSTPSTSGTRLPIAQNGRRSTINSITAHEPSFNSRLPPPNTEIKIPNPPSRSPTPPTKVIARGRGNMFTQEDRAFFIKFIQWRLRWDQGLTRNDLCEQLAEKTPHHSPASWAAHWSNNHDLPDKILAAARGEAEEYGEDDDTENGDSEEEEVLSRPRQPKYKESSLEDDEQDDQDFDEDDDLDLPSFDETAMGQSGGPFTDADLALVARYVASFDDFRIASHRQRWIPWSQRYPQRSDKSWAEYYRRQERSILSLARKIKRAGAAKGLSPKREVSDSADLAHLVPPVNGFLKTKRKYESDDERDEEEESDDGFPRSKISKVE